MKGLEPGGSGSFRCRTRVSEKTTDFLHGAVGSECLWAYDHRAFHMERINCFRHRGPYGERVADFRCLNWPLSRDRFLSYPGAVLEESDMRVLPRVLGFTRARSRNSATPSSCERRSSEYTTGSTADSSAITSKSWPLKKSTSKVRQKTRPHPMRGPLRAGSPAAHAPRLCRANLWKLPRYGPLLGPPT